MSTRRSARLQNLPTAGQPDLDKPDRPTEADIPEKRGKPKAPAKGRAVNGNAAPSLTAKADQKKSGQTKAQGTSKSNKSKAATGQSQSGSNGKLPFLPPEILTMILDNITDPKAMSALARTSKILYSQLMPRLYGRVTVSAAYHAHIAKLIRTLEPHISVGQKKQLKKEGKYKGQQERYSSAIDEKMVPTCASYVKHFEVGHVDPGRKHEYIVIRYVEEALKCMGNLEIVESQILTSSMARSIAALPHLEALRLYMTSVHAEEMRPLAPIKNLKHLFWQDHGNLYEDNRMLVMISLIQTLLKKSASTLQSLSIEMGHHWYSFLDGWGFNPTSSVKAKGTGNNQEIPRLTALEALTLSGMRIEADFIKRVDMLVDFTRLRELHLGNTEDGQGLLLTHLTNLMTSYQGTTERPLGLRYLKLQMDDYDSRADLNKQRSAFHAKCRFIASFSTLTTLILEGYGWEGEIAAQNPALTDTILSAILKHEKLEVLNFEYRGVRGGFEIPYLGKQAIESIVGGLPQLRALLFAPLEEEMAEISQILCRGRRLEYINCFPYASWVGSINRRDPDVVILDPILRTFLSEAAPDWTDGTWGPSFVWENYYKLRRVSAGGGQGWDIGSALKGGKTYVLGGPDKKRTVRHRLPKPSKPTHPTYDPEVRWVADPLGQYSYKGLLESM